MVVQRLRRWPDINPALVQCSVSIPANTKHSYNICTKFDQRLRRWADVVQMLYKYFVLAGIGMVLS